MNDRPQVLMVSHRFVYPPDRGDRIRTWHMLNELSHHCDVWLACLSDEPIHVADWEVVFSRVKRLAIHPIRRTGTGGALVRSMFTGRSITEHAFYNPSLHRTIREWSEDTIFDAALAVCSSTAGYLEGLGIRHRVIDLIDLDSRKWADYADHDRGLRRFIYQREAQRLARYERQLAGQYELAVTCEREARVLREIAPQARIIVARNGAAGSTGKINAGHCEPTVVFTGLLDYKPNVQGLGWFIDQVWPGVMSQVPGARFDIVGRNAGRAMHRLSRRPGVNLVGAVADVQPHLESARLAVAPLQIARGVQNKALEALAAGRPVVTTTQVRDGLIVKGDCPCIVPESTSQWTASIVKLLTQPALASALGAQGRLFIERHYNWSQTLAPLVGRLLPGTLVQSNITSSVIAPARAAA